MNIFAVIFAYLIFQAVAPAHAPRINEEMVRQYLAKQSQCDASQIYFNKFEYFSFTGHEYDDVIVVASTCNTGTAGPDVQSVFSWVAEGQLGELEIEEVNPKRYEVLFGNRNYDLSANPEDRELVETFYDSSGRDDPLVLMFQWDGKRGKFLLISAQSAPMYKTSYDCTKARKEVDRAICYVEPLAKLDTELNAAYSSLAKTLSAEDRKQLIREQREWVAKRDHDCVIYKFWVECLTDRYTARISELKEAATGHAQAPAPAH
jgi:uncharacterized protein YecT (DUF1311 family)